ncbi:MAG: DUF4962 domain-containing protein [Armatimonadetes bacterium]|nr:DUF4962 domain-containing protein [Armatimonadota bacterium]
MLTCLLLVVLFSIIGPPAVRAELGEPPAGPLTVRYTPEDGSASPSNPPGFVWMPETGAVRYELQVSRSPSFLKKATRSYITRLNIHRPDRTLPAGAWFWRYRKEEPDGGWSAFSRMRRFTVPENAPQFTAPSRAGLEARMKGGPPRVHLRAKDVERLRRLKSKEPYAALWQGWRKWCDDHIGDPLPEEPPPYTVPGWLDLNLKADIDTMWEGSNRCGAIGTALERYAFAFLLTGEPRYRAEFERWLRHLLTWDPQGTSGAANNDEAARRICEPFGRAFDWMQSHLSGSLRRAAAENLTVRARDFYEGQLKGVLISHYGSHETDYAPTCVLPAALALWDEVPESRDWLELIVQFYACLFPAYGEADGGWSQGPSYWKWTVSNWLNNADMLRVATGFDACLNPWARQTGYFKLYCNPPYSKQSPFGDHSNEGVPDLLDRRNMARLAARYGDGYLQWYADQLAGPLWDWPMAPVAFGGFLYNRAAPIVAKAPSDLPSSRYQRDIGWVAFRTDLVRSDRDIMLLFKSSPFGAFNHSHADQNAFIVNAYGEPLAISAGHYNWYHSPHHFGFNLQTKSKNTILVDGEGQWRKGGEKDITCNGRITAFQDTPAYAYACGDAARAYDGKLLRFDRHVVFVRPAPPVETGYFVIFDDLESAGESAFTWQLHAQEKMEIDGQRFVSRKNSAELTAAILYPEGLQVTLTDEWPVVEGRYADRPKQWHLYAVTPQKSRTARFVSVLLPHRATDPPLPSPVLLQSGSALGVRLNWGSVIDEIGFRLNAEPGHLALDGWSSEARLAAVRRTEEGKETQRWEWGGRG